MSNHDNGQARVECKPTDAAQWGDSVAGGAETTVAYDTTQATLTGLRNGEAYDVRPVAVTDGAETAGTPIQIQTDLPDEDTPVLLNGVEDEVGVDRETAVSNYGDVRIQIRETGQSTWDSNATGFGEFIGSYDTLTMEFVGREDGEEYEVRARTETEHVTGTWTAPVAITTKFPGATALDVTVVSSTEVDLAWTDQADNEDGQRVIREQRVDGAWWPEEILEDVGPNTESYTDTTPQPDTQYRYRIRPYTEHSSADSNLETTTTTALAGVRDRRVPASGYYVEVEHPSDETLRPTVLAEDNVWQPRLNGLPQVRLPVPRSSTWEDHDVEGAAIRCWKDGYRLPIDELRSIERDESQNVLVAIGGSKLLDDVEGVEYYDEDAHIAAEEVIENRLNWVANVDDPATDTRTGVSMLDVSQTDAIENAISGGTDGSDPFPATSPLRVFNGELYAQPTAFFQEAEDAGGGGTENIDQDGNWSGDRAMQLSAGDERTFVVTTDYTIPEGNIEAEFVFAIPATPTAGIDIRLDVDGGSTYTLESIDSGILTATGSNTDLRTYQVTLNPQEVGDLPPGDHSVDFEVTSGSDAYLDFAHIRDDRFAYDTSDTDPIDGVVQGWEQRPASIPVEFAAITSAEQVVAGQLDVTMAGTSAPNAIGLRNDQADAYDEATDATSHSVDFASAEQLIQARVTLGREDSDGTVSGTFGDVSHRVDRIEIAADLINIPVLIDFYHEGTFKKLLNRIADAGDSVWELRRADPSAGAEYRIEWAQPGQRVADYEPDYVSFSGRRTIEGSFQRVIAQGKSHAVEGETFEANAPGLLVGLDEEPIVPGTESVYASADRSTEFERGIDYVIDHREGAIETLDGGAMSAGSTYVIDYEWRYEGRYTDPDATDPDTLRESFPDASSDRECEQLAVAVVRQVAAPLEEATATISDPDPRRSLVEAIDPEALPFGGPLRVRESDSQSDRVSLTLGSRRSAGDVVDELRDRLSAIARNV